MTFRDSFPPLGGRIIRIDVRPATKADEDAFIAQLLKADWNAPDSPIRLADDLSLDDVKHVLFFDQARQFLRLMDENKGAPLTPTGNFNRVYVALMLERMDWLRRYAKPLLEGGLCKVINEGDIMPLGVLHGVCEFGKLVHKRRNRVFLTNKARDLLADAQAGSLYRQLFITLFRAFSLDFLSGFQPTPFVQHSIAVILWRLQLVARDWIALNQLPREVFLNAVSEQVRAVSIWPEVEPDVLRGEVLRPLLWFGLLECDHAEDEWHHRGVVLRFRKTPLFDHFLTFDYLP
ncbi:MAG: hypothetical protein NTX53_06560 [candidate division WOR-3 bacterium]|nr:hypothetical protein [candidate division WOR-3 bacterium]